MRITTRTLSRHVMTNLNNIYEDMKKYHTQVSTGKAFQKPSEDPINATRSMDVNSKLERVDQYGKNIDQAHSIFKEAEVSLDAVSDSIDDVKTDLLKALNASYNEADREVIAASVETMRDNIIAQLNKEYAGKHIFGGFNTFERPFTMTDEGVVSFNTVNIDTMSDTMYNSFMDDKLIVQTGKATEINTSIPGVEITGYGEDNLINVLNNITKILRDPEGSQEELADYTDKLDTHFTNVQNKISEMGTKMQNLQNMEQQNKSVTDHLKELLSDVEGVDIEEAIINYKTSEMVYNSALAIGAKVIQPTLIDFIR